MFAIKNFVVYFKCLIAPVPIRSYKKIQHSRGWKDCKGSLTHAIYAAILNAISSFGRSKRVDSYKRSDL